LPVFLSSLPARLWRRLQVRAAGEWYQRHLVFFYVLRHSILERELDVALLFLLKIEVFQEIVR
jgi:hypothetical protein